jgi:hypothetical protein
MIQIKRSAFDTFQRCSGAASEPKLSSANVDLDKVGLIRLNADCDTEVALICDFGYRYIVGGTSDGRNGAM